MPRTTDRLVQYLLAGDHRKGMQTLRAILAQYGIQGCFRAVNNKLRGRALMDGISAAPARNILFLSHELSRTGAPLMLMEAVRCALDSGDFPLVASPVDGPLREDYINLGVSVLIGGFLLRDDDRLRRLAEDFDLVVVNTLGCGAAIHALSGGRIPVLWWSHEGSTALELFRDSLPARLGKNIHLYCVSPYSQELVFQAGEDYHPGLLSIGMEDAAGAKNQLPAGKSVKMLCVGSVEHRKGQDLLWEAISKLPSAYRDRAEFILVGKPADEAAARALSRAVETLGCVRHCGEIPRDALLTLYTEAVCVLVPSRDDPLPTTAVEAAMFSRAVITSDRTGFGALVTTGQDGLVFPCGDAGALSECLRRAIDCPDELLDMGRRARTLYERYFTRERFRDSYTDIVRSLIGTKDGLA